MLLQLLKTTVIVTMATCMLNAAEFNKQAEKDRLELIKYFEAKFEDPLKNKNTFFPNSTDYELKNSIAKGLKHKDFAKGNYAFNIDGRSQYEEIKEMPPYDDAVEEGEAIYNTKFKNGNSFKSCFPNKSIVGNYPYFSDSDSEVVTLSVAINNCLVSNGEQKWNSKKGKIAKLEAFFSSSTMEAEKKINIKISSLKAQEAYERGKEYYYSQRGYLKLSCASCHVQGAGQRVRNEQLSQLLGQTTHFPVYRLKWNGLGTLERRMSGCIKDQGQSQPKDDSKVMKELLYFMSYMSNGMAVDGPDIRK